MWWELIRVFPEKFPDQALDLVTMHRITYLAADSQAETRGALGLNQKQDNKMVRMKF